MLAVTQTRKGVEKHTDTHRPTTQNWGAGPPEFSHRIESFLLRQTPSCFTAGPGFTLDFLDLPEHRCYYLSFSPLFQRAFFPSQGIPDEPPNVVPTVRVSGWERRLLETMQLAIGEFITDSSQGLPPSPRV